MLLPIMKGRCKGMGGLTKWSRTSSHESPDGEASHRQARKRRCPSRIYPLKLEDFVTL
jgi:hypothetical protein